MVAPVFATNCCVLAGENGDAVVVDAGAGVAASVVELIESKGLTCRAVLATHGHADHTWDAAALCDHFGVPFHIHEADVYRLADPFGTLAPKNVRPDQSVAVAIANAVRAYGLGEYRAPADVKAFRAASLNVGENESLSAGALELGLIHAPGHTEGSTLYLAEGKLFTGDVLFAGSIGRTDLPGGDPQVMGDTLRGLAGVLSPDLAVMPGHGPETTVARELASNPYWRMAIAGIRLDGQ